MMIVDPWIRSMPPAEKHMFIRPLLVNGLDYLNKHGWTQGITKADDGKVCALGALAHGNPIAAARQRRLFNGAYTMLCDQAYEASNGVTMNIIFYNDHHARRMDDVIAIYEKAIANCD